MIRKIRKFNLQSNLYVSTFKKRNKTKNKK